MNYDSLSKFLRIARCSIELAGDINSIAKLQEAAQDYSTGLSKKQVKIIEHIKLMEVQIQNKPSLAEVKRNIFKLERLMGSKIPEKAFSIANIN